ncbi:MAG: coproporphyrinogen dehydrogenase HemZ [Clostridia bacterium]|nr:coproporphyrinogen dehydrogenase HemZ [Clostridia bacterium]
MKIYSAEAEDLKVLHDLLKVHFPETELAIFPLEAKEAEEPAAGSLNLIIARQDKGLRVRLRIAQHDYQHMESTLKNNFPEQETNRNRRLLRLAVYRVLSKYFAGMNSAEAQEDSRGLSPWGVLTGVRPVKIVHRLLDLGFPREKVSRILLNEYGLRPDKAELVCRTAEYQRPYLLTAEEAARRIGIYISIPFCPTRCHYCSFPSLPLSRWGHLLEAYLEALQKEIRAVGESIKDSALTVGSVYLGGGTPTLLTAAQLDRLLKTTAAAFRYGTDCEVTVEGGRPDTLDFNNLQVIRNNQAKRLSINPQTMCERTLYTIGRRHTVAQIKESRHMAKRMGIPTINMDLIVGLPGEDISDLALTLTETLALRPENITLHALALKRAAIYRQENIVVRSAGWSKGQAMMAFAQKAVEKAGYLPYYLYRQKDIFAHGENVGYTLEGHVCRYNIEMMEEKQTIIGCGVGAGSKIINPRQEGIENIYNPKDLLMYLDRLDDLILKKIDKLKAFV